MRDVDLSTGMQSVIAGTGGAGFAGDGGQATAAVFHDPRGIARDASGRIYVADYMNRRVRRFTPGGAITTFAGGGAATSEGGPASEFALDRPSSIAFDPAGNLYIDGRYRVTPAGILTVVRDSGGQPISGGSITFDTTGNLYIASGFGASQVLKLTPNGTRSVVAGTGQGGFSGDGGPAVNAKLNAPSGVAVDGDGSLYVADQLNYRVRKIDTAGIISTVAGTGVAGNMGDGGPATSAQLTATSVATGSDGAVFISGTNIRKLSGGVIAAVAGNAVGSSGDGGQATAAQITQGWDLSVATDSMGNTFISGGQQYSNESVRKVTPGGVISTVAGVGAPVAARNIRPGAIATDAGGNVFVAGTDSTIPVAAGFDSVFKITPAGNVSVVAGTGTTGYSGDGDQATSAQISADFLAVGKLGDLFIAGGSRVRKVDSTGVISTIAGTGLNGAPSGDGGPATSAVVPSGAIAVADDGSVYVAQYYFFGVRKVSTSGTITTIETPGIFAPSGLTTTPNGDLYVADRCYSFTDPDCPAQVWRLGAGGGFGVVAGGPTSGYAGDGGPATLAQFARPAGLDVAPDGALLIGDSSNGRVRRVEPPLTSPPGSGYHPLAPSRVLDSRTATGGWNTKLVAGLPRDLQVTGLGGLSNIPAAATAVVFNVTVTGGSVGSFVTAYPSGTATPNASNLNFGAGETIANLATVKLGPGGRVAFANAVGSTDVIADVVGYYDDGATPGDLYNGITPTRLLDSRTTNGGWNAKLNAGTPRDLVVRQPGNAAGVPQTATAVIANVTVTGGGAGSFVSVWPSGIAQPNVSNLNFAAGQTIPNLAIIKIGTNGAIKFANAVGGVDVIVDVVGYFDSNAGSRFHAINPTRVLDGRVGNGLTGPWGPGQTRALPVAGPGTSVPAEATGLVVNVTVTGGSAGSFITVFPDGVAVPNSSNVNFGPGQTIPNLVTVKIAGNGKIAFYNKLGSVDIIADAVGYYATT